MSDERFEVGDLIRGDHRVLAVHSGHFGMVYVCRQELPGGNHIYKAIKTFRREKDLVSRGLFDRELTYWVQMAHHPNVVQARDADTVNKQLILDFIPGPNLREIAHRRPLEPAHFLRWAREIAAGLRFLHVENNFLHRDLRPANILIDTSSNLTAKISDLGIGKPFDPEAVSNTVIGTFKYMAPEVFRGRTDFRSDIFSYGATLYYLLTGRYAVPRSSNEMKKIVDPSTIVPIPDELVQLILRCLAREPEDRYANMDDVLADLEPIDRWPVQLPYRHCQDHAFSFYSESTRDRCPFCRYLEFFRQQETDAGGRR